MTQPDYPPWLPPGGREWLELHQELVNDVVAEFVGAGEWPRRADLQRALAAEHERPPTLSEIFDTMPSYLGAIHPPDQRIVLTGFALERTLLGRPLVEGFVRALRLAVDAYRNASAQPVISSQTLLEDPQLPTPLWRAVGEILLREAPFIGGGTGSAGGSWTREIREDVVRYWEIDSVEEYLTKRAQELHLDRVTQGRSLAAIPPLAPPVEPTRDRDNEAARPPLADGQADPPAGITVGVFVLVLLTGVLSAILEWPRELTAGVLAAAIGAAAIWRKGFRWPGRLRQWALLIAICGAAVSGAYGTRGRDETTREPPDRVTPEEREVDRFVGEIRDRFAWKRKPTIYKPSVDYFKRRFSQLDPSRPHRFNLKRYDLAVDLPTLAQRAPELSGLLLRLHARLHDAQLVSAGNRANSWALFLWKPRDRRTVAVCRAPLTRDEEDAYRPGSRMHVTGILIADGLIDRADGKGITRVLYLICSSVAKTQLRITITPEGIEGREVP